MLHSYLAWYHLISSHPTSCIAVGGWMTPTPSHRTHPFHRGSGGWWAMTMTMAGPGTWNIYIYHIYIYTHTCIYIIHTPVSWNSDTERGNILPTLVMCFQFVDPLFEDQRFRETSKYCPRNEKRMRSILSSSVQFLLANNLNESCACLSIN